MATFSTQEYLDILETYIENNRVSRRAEEAYQFKYPNRRYPNRQVFQNAYGRFRETGTPLLCVPELVYHRDIVILY